MASSNDRVTTGALALLGLAAALKIPTLGQPLTENFAWRQTQTAWTARIFHEQGIDLLRPEVPVHGPPWVFGFEFPLFQALGSLLMDLGMAPDVAMRTLGMATFLVTGWLLFLLARRLAGGVAAIAALAAFLFSPFGLLWGRTSLIEYLATALALGFLLAGIRWLEHRRASDFGLALGAGILAMLVKITTGAFYLLPLLAWSRDARPILLRDRPAALLVALPALAGLAWTRYIDGVKAKDASTAFQTSDRMIDFNFGTPGMRIDPEMLVPIAAALLIGLGGAGLFIWFPAGVARLRRLPQRWLIATTIATPTIGAPLVLTPLYGTQNYYPAAISPAVALLIGMGAAWAWDARHRRLGRLALTGGIACWAVALALTADLWLSSYRGVVDRDGSLAAAAYVRERTGPDDWVVIDGRGWDPTILYYADRRGYMLDPRRGIDDLERLRRDPRYTLFVSCPYESPCTELDR